MDFLDCSVSVFFLFRLAFFTSLFGSESLVPVIYHTALLLKESCKSQLSAFIASLEVIERMVSECLFCLFCGEDIHRNRYPLAAVTGNRPVYSRATWPPASRKNPTTCNNKSRAAEPAAEEEV